METLIKKIEQWAEDRNLIEGSTKQKQMLKLIEEYGELSGGVARNDIQKIKDSIGDCLIVLTILNRQFKASGEVFKFEKYLFDILSFEPALRENENSKTECIISGVRDLHGLAKLEHRFGRRSDDYLFEFIITLRFIADQMALTLKECVQSAWEEIKDRKGKMIDGVFVKEEDIAGK